MHLFVIVFAVSVLSISFGDKLSFEKNIAEAHFGKLEDFKDVNIPPEKSFLETDSTHPYQFELKNNGSGNYYFGFDTIFGLRRFEIGELKNAGTDNEVQVVKGRYTEKDYDSSTGLLVIRTIGYIADENGYRPFLISINTERPPQFLPPSPAPGGPREGKPGISTAAKAALLGGNPIG